MTNLTLQQVVQIRWPEVMTANRRRELNDLALQIAAKQVRFIKSDLFFWEINQEGRAWLLLDLEKDFERAVSMTWAIWKERLADAIAPENAGDYGLSELVGVRT